MVSGPRAMVFPLPETQHFVLFSAFKKGKKGIDGKTLLRRVRKHFTDRNIPDQTHYSNLRRLMERKWIRRVDDPEGDDQRVARFRITKEGVAVLRSSSKAIELLSACCVGQPEASE